MLTWLAVKSAWASFLGWCKERWELLVGVLVGVLGMIALRGSGKDMKKVLDEKNDLIDELSEADSIARAKEDEALRINLQRYLEAEEAAKKNLEETVSNLDDEKKSKLKELLSSDSPEEEIARRLKEYLD